MVKCVSQAALNYFTPEHLEGKDKSSVLACREVAGIVAALNFYSIQISEYLFTTLAGWINLQLQKCVTKNRRLNI